MGLGVQSASKGQGNISLIYFQLIDRGKKMLRRKDVNVSYKARRLESLAPVEDIKNLCNNQVLRLYHKCILFMHYISKILRFITSV